MNVENVKKKFHEIPPALCPAQNFFEKKTSCHIAVNFKILKKKAPFI